MSEIKELTADQLQLLKSPLPKEAISPHPTKTFLSTIKAIYVIERLNDVFGLGGWLIHNEIIEPGAQHIVVKSKFEAPEYGIVVPDIFGGNDNKDRGDAFKGACTDALTKIGSYLYVGMDVFKGLGDKDEKKAGPARRTAPAAAPKQPDAPPISQDEPTGQSKPEGLFCVFDLADGDVCGAIITVAEDRWSRSKFAKPLCREHQAVVKEAGK